ncbi:hypothetical protein MNBD_ALPHA02-1749 [hydrothermal vent metagenome]|uniref:SHOCT domain-containing protein n=1 Tax=hydrothermal vent metagenome TaxID=652676 RepID=A0A3B0SS80_9ZZZZ
MINHMNDSYGWGMGWGMHFFGMLFWILIIAGVVLFVRWIIGSTQGNSQNVSQDSPLAILKRRYANGEVDQETYERMKKELES